MKHIIVTVFVGFVLMAPTSQAQGLERAAERTASCLQIESRDARLDCFDTQASVLSELLSSEEASSVTSAPAAPESQADAGVSSSAPKWASAPESEKRASSSSSADSQKDDTPIWARLFTSDEDEATAEFIRVEITRILQNNAGRHYFITADGQEWRQTVPETVAPPSSLPAAATISESLMGSPRLSFDEGPKGAYPVRRTK